MKRVSGGHSSKTTFNPVFFPWFSSRFGRKNLVGPGEKFFSRVFHPLYFPPYAKQWKTHFSTPFSLLYFPPLLKSIQPNTLLNSQSSMVETLKAKPPSFIATKHHHHHGFTVVSLPLSSPSILTISLSLFAWAQPMGVEPMTTITSNGVQWQSHPSGRRSFFSPSLFFIFIFLFDPKAPFFLFYCFRFAWVWGLGIFGLRV